MIHVIATIELAAEKCEAFLAEFRRLVPLVRAEAGCLDYGPAVDVPSGLSAQPPPHGFLPVAPIGLLRQPPGSAVLTTPHLVELLKHPLCVGEARRAVLDQLGDRYGRRFADQWEFVRFAGEQGLDIDFTSPPRRR